MRAVDGFQESRFSLISARVACGASIFDFAAGAGTFTACLVDKGYSVTANDIGKSSGVLTPIPKLSIDLDRPGLVWNVKDGNLTW